MKTIYFICFFILIVLLAVFVLNFVEIPSPSKLIIEDYEFDLK